MILEKQKEANVLVGGISQESIGMSLDLDSAQMLMQMLSKSLYSDGIGSSIRECASNALDSHRRAGVKEPIVVAFKEAESYNYEFSVEDFGLGLDDEDVKNIISKYGKSTKRESITELGMFGLGFKAPLAYSSSFYFVCRKNGMERKYMMYEGEDINTIDLLYETPTTERNGVKIIIPVKYSDQYSFRTKIKEQLCYFEDVYFDVPGDSSITNDFTIVRHEHFQFSEMSTDNRLHICLDNVYYPLDFDKIGIKSISFPVALRFDLTDGIFPTPNRESLRYTQEAKEIIKDKLKIVADYFITKYNDSVEEGMNIEAMINYIEKSGFYIQFSESSYNIEIFKEYSTIPFKTPKLEGITLLDFQELYTRNRQSILAMFSAKYYLRHQRMSDLSKSGYSWHYNPKNILNGESIVYVYSDKIPGIKKDYLRATCNQHKSVFLVKNSNMTLGCYGRFNQNTYYHLLNLQKYPRSQWRTVIQEYQTLVGMLAEHFINLDELIVPQHFIDSRKKVKTTVSSSGTPGQRRLKIQGEIVGKRAEDLQRWNDGRNCKFVPVIYKLEDLEKAKHLKIYAHHDDYLKLDALYGIIGKQKIELVTFSQREINIIKDLEIHNLISLEKFMEGETAPFKRLVTAHYIAKLMAEYQFVFERHMQVGFTSTTLMNKLCTLIQYKYDNWAQIGYSGGSNQAKEYIDSMLQIATENNLFDDNIYPEALEMRELLTKLDFLNPFCKEVGYYNVDNPIANVMTNLFKYYKHRVNLKHYNIKIDEEVLTEETVEQLID
jgi:hypothetical protein